MQTICITIQLSKNGILSAITLKECDQSKHDRNLIVKCRETHEEFLLHKLIIQKERVGEIRLDLKKNIIEILHLVRQLKEKNKDMSKKQEEQLNKYFKALKKLDSIEISLIIVDIKDTFNDGSYDVFGDEITLSYYQDALKNLDKHFPCLTTSVQANIDSEYLELIQKWHEISSKNPILKDHITPTESKNNTISHLRINKRNVLLVILENKESVYFRRPDNSPISDPNYVFTDKLNNKTLIRRLVFFKSEDYDCKYKLQPEKYQYQIPFSTCIIFDLFFIKKFMLTRMTNFEDPKICELYPEIPTVCQLYQKYEGLHHLNVLDMHKLITSVMDMVQNYDWKEFRTQKEVLLNHTESLITQKLDELYDLIGTDTLPTFSDVFHQHDDFPSFSDVLEHHKLPQYSNIFPPDDLTDLKLPTVSQPRSHLNVVLNVVLNSEKLAVFESDTESASIQLYRDQVLMEEKMEEKMEDKTHSSSDKVLQQQPSDAVLENRETDSQTTVLQPQLDTNLSNAISNSEKIPGVLSTVSTETDKTTVSVDIDQIDQDTLDYADIARQWKRLITIN